MNVDSIYHVTLKLLKNRIFGVKTQDFAIFYTTNSLIKVKCIAEFSAIHLTFIKRIAFENQVSGFFESGRFTQVLLYVEVVLFKNLIG